MSLIDIYTKKAFDIEQTICKHSDTIEGMIDQKGAKCLWIEQFKEYHNFIELTRNIVVTLIEKILIHEDKNITIKYRHQGNYDNAVYFVQAMKGIS